MKIYFMKLFSTALIIVIVFTSLFGQSWTEHTIDGSFDATRSVYAVDVDGDGDMDVLGAAFNANDITWWENDGSESFTEHTIAGSFSGARSVYAVDVDGDGDMDVLGAARNDGDIAWWENDGSESFTKHTIDGDFNGAYSVYAADVDGDGDMDVLGAANGADDITWWENDGSESFTEHTIDGSFNGAHSVYAADVDGDGDMDVLGAAFDADDITWWENDGSESFTEHTIDGSFNGVYSVYAADVDGDGDMDVLGAARVADDITWWENDGSESFTEHTIDGSFNGASSVYAADVDGDGDMDVLGAAFDADDITWWENDGSESFTEHTIDGDFNGAISVYATDLDNDGDMDVLGAARVADDITWWEQQGTPSKTVSFTDGSSFSAAPTVGGSNQAIGRFNLNSSATFGFIAVTIKLTGTRSGASDFRLWQSSDNSFSSSSDIQLGSMVESDPGTDKTVTFNNFVSPISTSGSFYFLTCDVAAGGGGLIKGVIVSGSSLTFSGGTLSGSISNADLSSSDAALNPVSISGTSGFRMMSSPVSGAIYSDLLAELWIQGMTGGDVTSGDANVWIYSVAGQSWSALTNLSTASQTAGAGFLVYVYQDANFDGDTSDDADLPVTLSVSGTENSSSATVGSIADGNWALIGNPYYSTIDWDNVSKTDLATSAYVYDNAKSGGAGYISWNGETGSLSNGLIAAYQGFWVRLATVQDPLLLM